MIYSHHILSITTTYFVMENNIHISLFFIDSSFIIFNQYLHTYLCTYVHTYIHTTVPKYMPFTLHTYSTYVRRYRTDLILLSKFIIPTTRERDRQTDRTLYRTVERKYLTLWDIVIRENRGRPTFTVRLTPLMYLYCSI